MPIPVRCHVNHEPRGIWLTSEYRAIIARGRMTILEVGLQFWRYSVNCDAKGSQYVMIQQFQTR